MKIQDILLQSKQAGQKLAVLPASSRTNALEKWAELLGKHRDALLSANENDLQEQKGKIDEALYQRLELTSDKIDSLIEGTLGLASKKDPLGVLTLETRLDEDLTLERIVTPLGVVGIIFESRPDVIPQILALMLRSGNAVILKGGSEAIHSNRAFMKVVNELAPEVDDLPARWAHLFESREEIQAILDFPEFVDLVIPRGSNQLVQTILEKSKIPVLGHADGICHLYVHPTAVLSEAVAVIVDSKIQYPSACNALETLLVDEKILDELGRVFVPAAQAAGIKLRGCPKTQKAWGSLDDIETATEQDWKTEWGNLTLSVRAVSNQTGAMEHINLYGSHHTDGILAQAPSAQELFLATIDSASVFINASTRFADGFRYGFGAEVGISTSKTHARGPVGIEGLLTYKYLLRGKGQILASYEGKDGKKFLHQSVPLKNF